MSRQNSSKQTWVLYVLPGLVLLAVVMLYPIIQGVAYSLFNYNLTSTSPKRFTGLRNYLNLFTDPGFISAFLHTIVYVFFALLFEFILGFLFASLLQENFLGKNVLRGLLLLPWMMPQVVSAFVWSWILNGSSGVLNYILLKTGLIAKNIEWLSTPGLTLGVLIFVDIWISTPFVTLVLYAGLKSIPVQLYEAAMIDGAGLFNRVFKITLPMLKSAASVALLMRSMMAIRNFDSVWIMTRGGPAGSTELLSTFAYKKGLVGFNIGYGSAVTTFIFVISLLMSIYFIKVILRNR